MDNKYYIPKIDEFRVGFEYEVYLDSSDWEKQVYTNQTVIDEFGLKYKRYRVKYLSREDVESLGFNPDYIRSWDDGRMCFYNNYCALTLYKEKIHISNKDGVLFTGIIKNKSKLKEILECIIPTETE